MTFAEEFDSMKERERMRKQPRMRMRRSTDSVVGAFTAMSPNRRISNSSPGLTAASPATTALTRVTLCVRVCVFVFVHACVCACVCVCG